MLSDREAASIVTESWRRVHGRDPTLLERTYAQSIARFETGYGGQLVGSENQFTPMAERGEFNWGAEQRRRLPDGTCPPGFASGTDQGPVCFFVFSSNVEAATAFVRTLTKTRWPTVPAMRGSPEDVATAMRAPPAYFAGLPGDDEATKIRKYATGIRRNAEAIARTVPTPPLPSGLSSSSAAWLLGLGLVGAGGYLYVREYGIPAVVDQAIQRLRRLTS